MQDLAPLLGRPKRGTNLPIVLSTVTAVLICAALVSNGSRQPNELLTIYMPPYQSLHGGGASLANSNLMEEGSIKLDPNSANPSADFYANADDAGSDDDVMDAGPGGVLPGWTQPELLKKPDPEELQSFQAPSGQGLVFSPVDYSRNPGAIAAVNTARESISEIKSELSHSHQEAQEAKSKFEKEEAKAAAEEKKYQQFVQQQNRMKALMYQRMRQQPWLAKNHNWSPSDTVMHSSNGMWAATAKDLQQETKADTAHSQGGLQSQGDNLVIDPSKVTDAAAEYRKQMYSKSEDKSKLLRDEMKLKRDEGKMMADEAKLAQRQQLRMIDSYPRRVQKPRVSAATKEAAALREMEEKADLARDVTRLRLAQSKLAAAERKAPVFRGGAWQEGCPEGTPGCSTRSSLGYLEHPKRGVWVEASKMGAVGDRKVPVQVARNQVPTLI